MRKLLPNFQSGPFQFIASLETAAVRPRKLRRQVSKEFYPEPVGDDLKPNRFLRTFWRRLFARSLLAVLLYLLQPGVLLVADEQDDLAKASSLNKQVNKLYQAGKFNDAIPIAQEFLELSEKALGPDHADIAMAPNGS